MPAYFNRDDGQGEQSLDSIEIDGEQYTQIWVNHGDGEGEQLHWASDTAISTLEVSTNSPSNVGSSSAQLNGTLTDLEDGATANVWFVWRESGTTTWVETEPTSYSSTTTFSATIDGLESGTTYEYRSRAELVEGGTATARGSTVSFTADDTTTESVAVSTNSAGSITTDSADLAGDLSLSGVDSATVWFDYRESGASTWSQTSQQSETGGGFTITVDGLTRETTYEFRAQAQASGSSGTLTDTGGTQSFTTATPDILYDYDVSSLRLDEGQAVSQWTDSSSGVVADQTDTAAQPSYTTSGIAGNSTVAFDGDDVLTTGNFGSQVEQPYTIAGVAEWETSGYAYYGVDTDQRSFVSNDGTNLVFWAGNTITGPEADTQPHTFVAVADGTNSVFRVDDQEWTGDAGTLAQAGLAIGGRHDATQMMQGNISALRVYPKRLSSTERANVTSELESAHMSTTTTTTTIDDFEGSVASGWTNSGNYAVDTAVAASGSNSAYRSSGSAIRAGSGDLPDHISQGGHFVTTSLLSQSGTGEITCEWGRADYTSTDGWIASADWGTDTLELRSRVSGNTTTLDTTNVTLSADTWYDLTVIWTSDNGHKVWLSERSSDSVLGSVENVSSDHSGDIFAIWPSETGTGTHRIDNVHSSNVHPYTGTHYTEVDVEQSSTGIADATIGIDMTDYSSVSGAFDVAGSYHYRSNAVAYAGTHSLRQHTASGASNNSNANIETTTRGHGQPREAAMRTQVRPDSNFRFRQQGHNCRIMNCGLNRNYGSNHSGGGTPTGDDGWSVRLYIRDTGETAGNYGLTVYVYHMDQAGSYGDSNVISQPLFSQATWTQVTSYVRLNTVASDGTANADGVARIWVDGTNVFDQRDFRWDTTNEQGHDELGLANHWGGTETPDRDTDIWTDDLEIWLGNDVPSEFRP